MPRMGTDFLGFEFLATRTPRLAPARADEGWRRPCSAAGFRPRLHLLLPHRNLERDSRPRLEAPLCPITDGFRARAEEMAEGSASVASHCANGLLQLLAAVGFAPFAPESIFAFADVDDAVFVQE